MDQLAIAHFLLEHHRDVLDVLKLGLAESARWAEWDRTWPGAKFGSHDFLEAMSNALLAHDRDAADRALRALHGNLAVWPSGRGTLVGRERSSIAMDCLFGTSILRSESREEDAAGDSGDALLRIEHSCILRNLTP